MIERVERISPDRQIDRLVDVKCPLQRKVGIGLAGSIEHASRRIAIGVIRRGDKVFDIEPSLWCLVAEECPGQSGLASWAHQNSPRC